MQWTTGAESRESPTAGTRGAVIFFSKVAGFAFLIALSARLRFAVPGTPVPATFQTLAVLLARGMLGPLGGVSSVITYLAAGLAGAPIFASGGGPLYLLGPTGGYLLGYLPGVWVAGFFSRRAARVWSVFAGFLLATGVIHLAGWAHLSALGGPEAALRMGTAPFMAWDALKALAAAGLVRAMTRRGVANAGPSEEELG